MNKPALLLPRDIRPIAAADVSDTARLLTRAFDRDPMIDWLAGDATDAAERARRSARLFAGYLQLLSMPHGMALLHEDGAAALWSPPGKWQMGVLAQARFTPTFIDVTGWRRLWPCFLDAQEILAAHPRAPHYYLQVLGVEPAAQGRGLGRQLLQAGLAIADAAGQPCYLETMNPDNIGFYQRHGFSVTRELRLARSGYRVWCLWRPAAQAG